MGRNEQGVVGVLEGNVPNEILIVSSRTFVRYDPDH